MTSLLVWPLFLVLVIALLYLDLKVFHRHPHSVSLREAGILTLFWVCLGLLFMLVVYFGYSHHWFGLGDTVGDPATGGEATLNYLTAWLIEKSLSVDNLFVMAMIFAYFKIPMQYQHGVLFWGILGAIVFRGVMIGFGSVLVHQFEWVTYIFGGLLLYSAFRMARSSHEEVDPHKNAMVRLLKRFVPIENTLGEGRFFVHTEKGRAATTLMLALAVIETTDIIFAVDSIPAVFSITADPFIVFTSNIFAILGLRSLYFLLAVVLTEFRYLQTALVVLLAFIGIKMLVAHWIKIPVWISLLVILLILTVGVVSSLLFPGEKKKKEGF